MRKSLSVFAVLALGVVFFLGGTQFSYAEDDADMFMLVEAEVGGSTPAYVA